MFCGECGTKNEDGVRFCGNCGATIETPIVAPVVAEKAEADFSVGNVVNFFAPAEGSAKLEVGGITLQADLIFKGLAIALVAVLVILPFLVHGFTIAGYSNQVSRNFFRHFSGAASTTLSIFVLLTPIALFCLFQFKDKIKLDANLQFIAVIGLAAFGFLMPFIVRAQIFRPLRALHDNRFVNVVYWVNPAIGFILTLLLYVVVAAVAVGFMLAVRKTMANRPQ